MSQAFATGFAVGLVVSPLLVVLTWGIWRTLERERAIIAKRASADAQGEPPRPS